MHIELSINLKKGAKRSFKGTDSIFVNGRKEYVKYSGINCFTGLFGIIRICHIHGMRIFKQEKDSLEYKSQSVLFCPF